MRSYLQFIQELFLFERRKSILILFSSIITIVSLIFFIRFLFLPYTGLIVNKPEVEIQNNSIVFSPSILFSPAIDAGLKPDRDSIIAINKKSIPDLLSLIETVYDIKTFSELNVKVERDTTDIREYSIQPDCMLFRIDWICLFLLSSVLIYTGYCIIIFLHNQKYYPFALCLFLYLLYICVRAFYYENIFSMLLIHLGNFSIFLLPIFALYYPKVRFKKNMRICIVICLVCIYLVYFSVSLLFYCMWLQTKTNNWFQLLTTLDRIKNILEIGTVLLFFFLLFHAYIKNNSKKEKKQIAWILTGFVIALSPYFFFDHLPFIIGNMIGEKVSLGNFSHIFLCIFPICFLIGTSEVKQEKYKFFLPQYVYFIVCIPIVLFLFLSTAQYVHSYFIIHYGFSKEMAYLFYAFLYVLCIQPIVIGGFKIIKKKIYNKNYKKSPDYIVELESENRFLHRQKQSGQIYINKILQTEKLIDLSEIIKGIHKRVINRSAKISQFLLSLKKHTREILSMLFNSSIIEEVEFKEKKNDINTLIHTTMEENMCIHEIIDTIQNTTHIKPSLPIWINSDYIIQKVSDEIKQKYPYAHLRIQHMYSYQFHCSPGDIIYSFTQVLSFLLEITSSQNEVMIASLLDDGFLTFDIELKNAAISHENIKKIFRPFSIEDKKINGLGLYISKVLIEKNSGNVSMHVSEHGIRFVFSFLLEKRE